MIKRLSLFFLLLIPLNVFALDKVRLDKCIDGDTAYFIYKGDSLKFRFLSIDTPEYTTKKEKYGKEASEYTCKELKQASKIEIEYENKSSKKDIASGAARHLPDHLPDTCQRSRATPACSSA